MDGYEQSIIDRTEKFKFCSATQLKINHRLKEIASEISEMPLPPKSIDNWIDSWIEPHKKSFSINSFKKHLKIKKEYSELIENSDANLREMRIIAIEDLIEKINNINKNNP